MNLNVTESKTDDLLGSTEWGIGPTAVALRIDGPWVYGALVNNVWSLGGNNKERESKTSGGTQR